jgi:hypothetical protein
VATLTARRGWLVPAALVFLSWPVGRYIPIFGLDPSWQAGLHMAASQGLDFGRDVTFTYGPLGFLDSPTFWEPTTGMLAMLYAAAARLALCSTVYFAARRSFGMLPAAALTLFVADLTTEQQLPLVVFALCVVALRTPCPPARLEAWAAAAGVLGGVELLVKPPRGIAELVLALMTLLAMAPRRVRALAALAAGFMATVAVAWLATGQSVHAVGPWLHQVREFVSGYAGAMNLDTHGRGWEYPAAALAALAGLAAVRWGDEETWWRRPWLGLLWVAFAFFLFKEGFIRHDGHSVHYFGAAAAGLLVLAPRVTARRVVAALAVLACAGAAVRATKDSLGDVLDPVTRAHHGVDAADAVVESGPRNASVEAIRAFMRTKYAVPADMLAAMKGRTVSVWPSETAIAWAYRLRWRPLPAYQSYLAYTAYLDRLDARFASSPRAPDLILYERGRGIDGRWLGWDAPRTFLALLCDFHTGRPGREYLLLARSGSRCGPPRPLGGAKARWGQAVRVPAPSAPDMLVTMRVHGTGVAGAEKLRGLLFKPYRRYAVLDGQRTYRFVSGSGEDTPLPIVAGSRADLPRGFRLAPGARSVSFERQGGNPRSILRYSFSETRVGR